MNTRLQQIIDYSTGGNASEFAALMGWTPQYLYRMLKGQSGIGLQPILSILKQFPEIDARWLLLGEGAMVNSGADEAKAHLYRLLTLEKYMPVMTPEQLHSLTSGNTDFPAEVVAQWESLLTERNDKIHARFAAAYKKQDELCSQSKANK